MPRGRLVATALVVLAVASACESRAPRSTRKLVVLGFDGLDPRLTSRWMQQGRLRHFAALAQRGRFLPLGTVPGATSEAAWATLATGVNPGRHAVFDPVARDPATYRARMGTLNHRPGRAWLGYLPLERPVYESRRQATSFWTLLDRAGVRTSVLTVPLTFPPEPLDHGELLAGSPLPDLRNAVGAFHFFATDAAGYDEGPTEFGGLVTRLRFAANVAHAELTGPNGLRVPFTIRWNRDAPPPAHGGTTAAAGATATIDIQGRSIHLTERTWSRWISIDFRQNFFRRYRGMAQVYLATASRQLRLYVSPVNWRPESPPSAMSSPAGFAGDLFDRLGAYRTLGWAEATWPLQEGRIDEAAFMEDLYRAFDDRAQVILSRIDSGDWEVLIGAIDSADRVQHMFWRLIDPEHPMYDAGLAAQYGDAIERVYRRADELVGQTLERLDPAIPVAIVSGHGFHSWRKSVNLNTWLVEQGYQARRGAGAGAWRLAALTSPEGVEVSQEVDWSRTRAYALGFGQVFVNLRTREAHGLVTPGAEYDALVGELAGRLLGLTDPEDGTPVVRAVYKKGDLYAGPFTGQAADLQVGLAPGYRVSWLTLGGGAPPGVVYPNARAWSGDHAGVDFRETPGLLITTLPMARERPELADIAPTVLKYFGVPIPSAIDGRPLF